MKCVQISPNTGKCGPEITPYLDTFHTVYSANLTKELVIDEFGETSQLFR